MNKGLKPTLYRQKVFVALHDGFRGNAKTLALQIGCTQNCARQYRKMWNDLDPEEQEKAYREAKAILLERTAHVPPDRQLPEEKSELGGFHTPYKLPKNRVFISHY